MNTTELIIWLVAYHAAALWLVLALCKTAGVPLPRKCNDSCFEK